MFNSHHRHQQFFCNKEMSEMYISVFLMNVAEGMINIFVPIYLYSLHYSIPQILVFFLISQFCSVVFALPVARVVAKIGAKHAILISTPFLIAYFFGLRCLPTHLWLFFVLPLGVSFRALFYNFGFELNYLDHCDRKKIGRDLSFFTVFSFLAAVVSPIIGGLVIVSLGYKSIFLVGSVFLICSTLPLLLSKDKYRLINFTGHDILKDFFARSNAGMILSFTGYAVESHIGRVVWPIFLSLILITVEKVGYISSLSAFLTIIMVYFVGKWSDHVGSRIFLRWGTVFYFFGWLGCLFADSTLKIFAINSFKDVSQRFLILPWNSAFYKITQTNNYFRLVVLRDMIFNASRVLVMPFVILLFLFNSNPFPLVFLIAALFSLLYPLIDKMVISKKSHKIL